MKRSRSSPAILLFSGCRCKREEVQARAGGERGSGVAGVVAAVAGSAAGGGGSERALAGVCACGWAGGGTAGDGASATGEGDRIGAAEERQGGFGDAGASVASRSASRGVDGEPADAAVTAADAAADHAGPATGQGQEPVAGGAASGRVSQAGRRCVRQEGPGMAGRAGAESGGTGGGRGVAEGGGPDGRGDPRTDTGTGADGEARCQSAMVAVCARDRGVFGDGDPG